MFSPTLGDRTEICAPAGYFPGRDEYFDEGDWHHIAMVRQGMNFALYVDGLLIPPPTRAQTGSLANTADLWLGNMPDKEYYFDGLLDELRF